MQLTPDLRRSFAALKLGEEKPHGVDVETWQRCEQDARYADSREKDKHYRIVVNSDGVEEILMLDKAGRLPKVRLMRVYGPVEERLGPIDSPA